MDLVVPVIASCGQLEGQRAALGSRRPRRTIRERKDRPTSPSWVSGAWGRALRVAGALRPVPERAPLPRPLLPRPPGWGPGPGPGGSAAARDSPRGLGHFRGPERGGRAGAGGLGAAASRPGVPGRPPSPGGEGAPRRVPAAHLLALCGFGEHGGGGAVPRAGAQSGPRLHESGSRRPLWPALDSEAFTLVPQSLAAAACSFGSGDLGMEGECIIRAGSLRLRERFQGTEKG